MVEVSLNDPPGDKKKAALNNYTQAAQEAKLDPLAPEVAGKLIDLIWDVHKGRVGFKITPTGPNDCCSSLSCFYSCQDHQVDMEVAPPKLMAPPVQAMVNAVATAPPVAGTSTVITPTSV
jgi:hypothetical protein